MSKFPHNLGTLDQQYSNTVYSNQQYITLGEKCGLENSDILKGRHATEGQLRWLQKSPYSACKAAYAYCLLHQAWHAADSSLLGVREEM